jgi:peptidoglycan/xylan/chitin deacetylase (PgdA/CDA1 family)
MKHYSKLLDPQGTAIFLFHGVITAHRHPIRNYTHKHLLESEFVEVLEDLLEGGGKPVSMTEIAGARGVRALPPGAFAVTFDDGFENNFSVAAPVLKRLRVPATFYLTTAFLEENCGSWIDRIERALEAFGSVHLSLPELGVEGGYADPPAKIALLDRIRYYAKHHPEVDPYALAGEIVSKTGTPEAAYDPQLDRMMSWDQVRTLARNPLFTVGGHGHTHRILEFLPTSALVSEIDRSLTILNQRLGAPVRHYSYPEGLANCYSDRVIGLLGERGVACSPTAEPGINRPGDDLFRLKRIMVS